MNNKPRFLGMLMLFLVLCACAIQVFNTSVSQTNTNVEHEFVAPLTPATATVVTIPALSDVKARLESPQFGTSAVFVNGVTPQKHASCLRHYNDFYVKPKRWCDVAFQSQAVSLRQSPPLMLAQAPDSTSTDTGTGSSVWLFLRQNFAVLLWGIVGLLEVIVRLTPSDRDNSLLNYLVTLLDKVIPNRRTGGGSF